MLLWLSLMLLGCGLLPEKPPAPVEAAPAPPPAVVVPAPPAAPTGDAPAWVEAAVAEAISWEEMPGTTGEEDDGTRANALRAFFLAHPEYADAGRRERLAAEACGLGGTEQAHAHLVNPPKKEPLVVEVTSADWKLFVGHASHNCTSDDWGYYSSEHAQGAEARGITTRYAGPANDVVVVQRDGKELLRIPLSDQGFVVAKPGGEPLELGYSPEVMPGVDAYFGLVPPG